MSDPEPMEIVLQKGDKLSVNGKLPACDSDKRMDLLRAILVNDAQGLDREGVSLEWGTLMDKEDGINTWASEALLLTNKCKNIVKTKSSYGTVVQVLQKLDCSHIIPEDHPLPDMVDIPTEFQIGSDQNATNNDVEVITLNNESTSIQSKITDFLKYSDEKKEMLKALEEPDRKRSKRSNGGKKGRRRREREEDPYEDDLPPEDPAEPKFVGFKSAKEVAIEQRYRRQQAMRERNNGIPIAERFPVTEGAKTPFVPPYFTNGAECESVQRGTSRGTRDASPDDQLKNIMMDTRMKSIDQMLADRILKEIVEQNPNVHWDDIAGLKTAKDRLWEMIIAPMLKPELFTGLRAPGKGVLLFGPPGTGKTMIGKCIASQCKATFFSISASVLTSKWIGEGEKMVRAMFTIARVMQPTVIFIDEIDSLLMRRTETDHESSMRMKNEFLAQFDGLGVRDDDKLLVIGATNRPEGLDDAARRRFTRKLYIPLPDTNARLTIVKRLMDDLNKELSVEDYHKISELTDGYSGADVTTLCKEAAMFPIREMMSNNGRSIQEMTGSDIRPVRYADFLSAVNQVKSSVSSSQIVHYENWNTQFGSLL